MTTGTADMREGRGTKGFPASPILDHGSSYPVQRFWPESQVSHRDLGSPVAAATGSLGLELPQEQGQERKQPAKERKRKTGK